MKTSYCTVTVPVRKKDNVIDLAEWKTDHGLDEPASPAPQARRSRRSHRPDLAAVLELLATAAMIGVIAALAVRVLLA